MISKEIQRKADKVMEIINSLDSEMELELDSVEVKLFAIPSKVKKDGSFFVVTGTKQKPAGIGNPDAQLVFLYSEVNGTGIFVSKETIVTIIKEERKSLKIGIDEEYKKMGVWLNLAILTSYLDEDFLSALPQFSLLDSSTEPPS
jgi:hypothetical protein